MAYLFSNMDFLKVNDSTFQSMLVKLSTGQIFLYGITFILLSTGKKWFRILYWIDILISFLLIYFPIHLLLSNLNSILPFFILVAFMLLKAVALCQVAGYLKNNRWCKIYFDHTIELDDEDDDWVEKQTKNVNYEKIKSKFEKEFEDNDQEENEEYVTEKAPMTLPQLSVRLGIIVYGELILFPILIQIFSNLFESMDMQKVFATKDIFVLCIFTAFIWTIPLFYMYYNHKYTKKIIACCMLGEIIRILVYLPTFMKYYNSHEYSIRVFVFFTLIDFIRLLILFVFAIHVLKSEQEYAPSPRN
ncbi:hypothetical protein [uncultured Holdemanella sp.]|uniref:hypothetical protein n=1 Tax=uncultured Holdemanella sp. TaxID=1763549 RepID=UPI0025D74003|nr:hypothetical protein [uncultured Holdemanella sp.]